MLDALPFLGSSASIALMKDIILRRAVPETTANEWMLAIALTPIPDASMLEAAYELLRARKDASTVFSASSLAYTYCKQNEDCRWVDASVDGIIQLLEDRATEAYDSHKTDRVTQETVKFVCFFRVGWLLLFSPPHAFCVCLSDCVAGSGCVCMCTEKEGR